jgi:putative peptidoglycan lipid II flippase
LKKYLFSFLSTSGGQNISNSIVSSVFVRLLDKGLGFFKVLIIATVVGLSFRVDVFYLAVLILSSIGFIWANALDYSIVPKMVNLYNIDIEKFKHYNAKTIVKSFLFSILLSLLFYFLVPPFIGFFWKNSHIDKDALIHSFRMLLPVLVFYLPYRYLGAVLRVTKTYNWFYFGELVVSVVALLLLIIFREKTFILEISYIFAIITAFFSILLVAKKYFNFSYRGNYEKTNFDNVKIYFILLLLLESLFQFCDKYYVSLLEEKSISYYTISATFISIIPYVVSLTGPFLIEYQNKFLKKSQTDATEYVLSMFKKMVFLSVLLAIFSGLFIKYIIPLFFLHGKFSNEDSVMISNIIITSLFNFLPLSILPLLDQICYVNKLHKYTISRYLIGILTVLFFNYYFFINDGFSLTQVIYSTIIGNYLMLFFYLISLNFSGINLKSLWVDFTFYIFLCLFLVVSQSYNFYFNLLFLIVVILIYYNFIVKQKFMTK